MSALLRRRRTGCQLARLNRAVKERNRREAVKPLVDLFGLALTFALIVTFFWFLRALRGGG